MTKDKDRHYYWCSYVQIGYAQWEETLNRLPPDLWYVLDPDTDDIPTIDSDMKELMNSYDVFSIDFCCDE